MTPPTRTSTPLVTVEELAEQLDSANPPLVIDARPAEQFAAGHLAGAVHLDLWGVSLIDTSPAPLRAFTWMVAHLFALRGVTPQRPVIVYQEDSGPRAARLFWFLEYLGHPGVHVLDGGIRAWSAAGHATTTAAIAPAPSTWQATPVTDRVASWQDVLGCLRDPGTTILDTRSDAEFTGAVARAKRGGAIPGALHLEWTHNLAPDGRFKPASELRRMYAQLGVSPHQTVVTYCQGGYRAAHTYLALRTLGFPDVRNYTGSWKEWGDREDLPLAGANGVPPADPAG
ncbi:MAG: rhodanese-like domain-containing protein [Vicinamibacterales bacterium]